MKILTFKISRAIVFASLACSLLVASSGFAQDSKDSEVVPMPDKSTDSDESNDGKENDQEEDEPRTAESLGLLKDIVSYGVDGNWTTSVEENNFCIHGPDAVGDVKYYYINTNEKHWGERTFKVKVEVREGASAGMIYGLRENPKRYYMIIVNRENELTVVQRTANGFKRRKGANFDHEEEEPVELEVRENGNHIDLFVNGNKMFGFGNDSVGKGGAGIIAVDAGDYVFSNFELMINEELIEPGDLPVVPVVPAEFQP